MQQLLASLEDERQRQFCRFVKISAAVHVGFAVLFWIGPIHPGRKALPMVERVALVEALPAAPAARPAPAPARPAPAKPKPPPPPPPPAKKVLPKQPAPLPKPKPAEAKPKPEVKPEPAPKPQEEPAPEQDLDDVLAQLRDERGEAPPTPVEQAAAPPAATVGPAGGPGILVDPATARWVKEVKIHVTRAWIVPEGFRSEKLVTVVEVDLSGSGLVLGTRVVQRSGNPWYDESVERAIEKASPVPAPPEAGEWQFTFDSREMQ